MREIGSEFWDVQPIGKENNIFPESTQWFLSGRSALSAILKDLVDCQSVSVPSWCCDSMIKPFIDAGMEIRFYSVYWLNELIQDINKECDVLFLIDYFGYTHQKLDLDGFEGVIIRDTTHSIFSATYNDADYYFGSLRKWCGVWTGGYVWTKDAHRLNMNYPYNLDYVELREKSMQMKERYIKNRRLNDKHYLKVFEEAEDILENVEIALASDRDIQIARQIDVEMMKARRRENASILRKAFSDWLIFKVMETDDCPMFVPVIVPGGKRDELRSHLIKNEIYCPVHWPVSTYHMLDEKTDYIYRNELSLVCDQRYTEKDMYYIIETINAFMEEL